MSNSSLADEQKQQIRYWIYTVGCDLVACYSQTKDKFKEYWSNNRIDDIDYDARLEQGFYDDGSAIINGPIRHGKYQGKYITTLDFDTLEAFLKFSANDFDYTKLASKTRLEWHGNLARIHVFFITDRPFQDAKGGGLEVKATNKFLTFVSPSIHKDGNPYIAFGTEEIVILDDLAQTRIENRIAAVIPNYLSEDQANEYIKSLEIDGTIIHEGERHNSILVMANSLFFRYTGEWSKLTDAQRFERLIEFDKQHCRPPLYETSETEFKQIWRDIERKFTEERDERRDERQEANEKTERKSRSGSGSGSKEKNKEVVTLVREASKKIMESHSIVTLEETDEILYFRDGVFVRGGEIVIRKAAEAMFEYDLNINDRAEIREHIKCHTYHTGDEFDSDLNIINLKNGLYKIKTDEFSPHETNDFPYLSMKQKSIRFNRSVGRHPSKFIKFLKEVVYASDIWTVIELMAYTFLRDNPFEIITILLGGGSNGKSVLFGVLTALHGTNNVSNVSLKTIIERPFGLYDLVGKDCNLDAEMSSGVIQDTAILKKITGRQLIRVEQKNQKAFDARIYAKEWLNCNTLPQIGTNDQNDAYYRRNVIVGFPNKFEEKDYRPGCLACQWEEAQDRAQGIFNQDIDLTDKLTTPEELSAIFNLLMYALRGILKNKRIFINEKTMQERRQKYEMAANPVAVFLRIAMDPESTETDATTKETAYLAYQKFCKHYKLAVMGSTMFGKQMKLHIEDKRETINGKTVRVWKGLKLTKDFLGVVPEQETLDAADIWGV